MASIPKSLPTRGARIPAPLTRPPVSTTCDGRRVRYVSSRTTSTPLDPVDSTEKPSMRTRLAPTIAMPRVRESRTSTTISSMSPLSGPLA